MQDRPAPVGAQGPGHQAGRHRGRRTAAGTSRRPVRVPRVAGHPPRRRLAHGVGAELGQVRLADDHGAGGPQPSHGGAVGARRARVNPGAAHRRNARDVGVVFDRDRDAGQRRRLPGGQSAFDVRRLRHRLIGQHHPKRVQRGVQPRDPLQMQRHQLLRRNLAIAHQPRLQRHPGKDQPMLVHGGHPCPFAPTPTECRRTFLRRRPARAPRSSPPGSGPATRRRAPAAGPRCPAAPARTGCGGNPVGCS